MSDTVKNISPGQCPECGATLPAGAPEGLCPVCLMRQALAASPAAPAARLGDYELLDPIAHGGMGVVYRARQTKLNRIVALKMILSGHLAAPGEIERFKIEAEAAAQLDHPNIVPIFEVGELGGRHFFTMKLVEGGSLAQALGRGSLESQRSAELLAKVARAVHYAHQRGILHRDIKPNNILLDDRGEPQLTDFGLARMLHSDGGLTQTMAVLGSANYMSPEQARGLTRQLTTATDVYGLGAVLYEMLTGRPPFPGETMVEILQRVVHEEPVRPASLNSKIDRDLETICLKCLEKEPGARYHSAEALALDLERWLRQEPVTVRPVTSIERLAKWARRRPAIAGLAAGLILVSLVGLVAVLHQWQQAEAARAKAEASALAEATAHAPVIQARQVLLTDFMARQAILLPDARQAVLATPRGLELWDLQQQTNVFQLENARGAAIAMSLSADGRRLAGVMHPGVANDQPVQRLGQTTFMSRDQAPTSMVKLWSLLEGKLLLEFDASGNPITCVRLSPDGKHLATAHFDGTIELRSVADGALLWRKPAHSNSVQWLDFSHDGRRLLTAAHMERRMISGLSYQQETHIARCFDVSTGREMLALENRERYGLLRSRGFNDGHCVAVWSPDDQSIITLAARRVNQGQWNAQTGRRQPGLLNEKSFITSVAFSTDGKRMATTSEKWAANQQGEFTAQIWDRATGRLLHILRGHEQPLQGVLFSPGDRRVLTWSTDQTLRLWEVDTGVGVAVLRGHEAPIRSAIFSPDGLDIVSVADDKTVRLWPAATLEQLALKLEFHRQGIAGLRFSPDSCLLASGGGDARVAIWEVAQGRLKYAADAGTQLPEKLREQARFSVRHLEFDPAGRFLAAGPDEPQIRTYRVDVGRGAGTLLPRSPVQLIDLEKGALRNNLTGFPHPLTTLSVSHDGRHVAALPANSYTEFKYATWTKRMQLHSDFIKTPREVYLWDTQVGQVATKLGPILDNTYSAAFSPDDRRLVTTSWDAVQIWEVPSGQLITNLLTRFQGELVPLKYARDAWWSPDGSQLLVNLSEQIGVWDAATALPLRQTPKLKEAFDQARYFPNLGMVDAVTFSGAYYRWDINTGAQLRFFPGKTAVPPNVQLLRDSALQSEINFWRMNRALLADWSTDGKLFATRQVDREVEIWSTETGRRLARLTGHNQYVTALAFSPDGRWLASGDLKGVVRVWPLAAVLASSSKDMSDK